MALNHNRVAASCRLEGQGQKVGSLISALSVPVEVPAGGNRELTFKGYGGPKSDVELSAERPVVALGRDATADVVTGELSSLCWVM